MAKLKVCLAMLTLLSLASNIQDFFADYVSKVLHEYRIVVILLMLGLTYFFTIKFSKRIENNEKDFVKKILREDYERQKVYYTKYQLLGLYGSKKFINFKQTFNDLPCMPYEQIMFSDEEG